MRRNYARRTLSPWFRARMRLLVATFSLQKARLANLIIRHASKETLFLFLMKMQLKEEKMRLNP
jgi:hypothetical protein